jgi:hypothetical protein
MLITKFKIFAGRGGQDAKSAPAEGIGLGSYPLITKEVRALAGIPRKKLGFVP